MFNALVIAVVQLVASYFLAPFTTAGATTIAQALKLAGNPLAEGLVLAVCLGLIVWVIGLVIAVLLGARYPLLGALILTLIFAVVPTLLARYAPAANDLVTSTAGRVTTATRVPLTALNITSLFAFVGYWLAMLFRGR